ncbi:MAG: hypothetical protein JOY68_05750 [Candidatus Dormibacteraeota bacterium]|nr:hypothetical protein [Candidatus Dormibacteraeota bacterium]
MRSIIAALNDDELLLAVNESWTLAGVLGHIAFWDGRVLALAGKLQRGEAFTDSDTEPEDVDWINDASAPLIHAIPARLASEFALRIAEDADRCVAELPRTAVWPDDPESPITAPRAIHRGEHLDEVEGALGRHGISIDAEGRRVR